MMRRAEISLAIAAAALLAGSPVAGQTGPAPDKSASPWNATTKPPQQPPPTPATGDGSLSLRVYAGLNASDQLPYRPRQPDDPAYAVDVSAIMSRCADGSIVIKALLIGGHLTPLDNRCNDESGHTSDTPAAECDAATWNCSATPAK